MRRIRGKLADHVGDHVALSPEGAVLVTSPGTKLSYPRPPQSLNPSQTVTERLEIRKTSVIPLPTGKPPLSKEDGPQNGAEIAKMRGIPYREAVGALLLAANMIRPDLAYTAHTLAKFGDNPGPEHCKAVMKALQYLKQTASLGVTYGGATEDNMKLSACVDADHASRPDTRRSVLGGAVVLGEWAISWLSRAQRIITTATSESKYVALAEIVNELRFLRQVKAFMVPPIDYNIRVREDNESAIKMAENKVSSRRTRHIDVKHHMVWDAVNGGIVCVEFVKSGEQHTDVLTGIGSPFSTGIEHLIYMIFFYYGSSNGY